MGLGLKDEKTPKSSPLESKKAIAMEKEQSFELGKKQSRVSKVAARQIARL